MQKISPPLAPLLKVGELAKLSGVTVRTLHHYDGIGLLRPSARSDADYRLYAPQDVARLHGIQVLRHLGLSLQEIGAVLGSGAAQLPLLVARQMRALEREIEQASALHRRLALVQQKVADGHEPELSDWLDTLQLMAACDKHFNGAEMKVIFGNWADVQSRWQPLFDETQALMDTGASPLEPAVQALAQRWSNLSYAWMQGDFDLMMRWGRMVLSEPAAQTRQRPGPAMLRFIDQALQARLVALGRHLDEAELKRLVPIADAEWAALAEQVQALKAQRLSPQAPPVRAALARWGEMLDRSVGGDAALRAKIKQAYESEPLLRDSGPLPSAVRAYLIAAAQAGA